MVVAVHTTSNIIAESYLSVNRLIDKSWKKNSRVLKSIVTEKNEFCTHCRYNLLRQYQTSYCTTQNTQQ